MSHGIDIDLMSTVRGGRVGGRGCRWRSARVELAFLGLGLLLIGCGKAPSAPNLAGRTPVSVPDRVVPTVVATDSSWAFHLEIPSTFVNVGRATVFVHNICDVTIGSGKAVHPAVFLFRPGTGTTPIDYQRSVVCDLAMYAAPVTEAVAPGDSLSTILEFSVRLSHPPSAADSAALGGTMQLMYTITTTPGTLLSGMPQIPADLRTSPVFHVVLP
jgi:hypothetical protein